MMSLNRHHVSERTCIACRQVKPKKTLVRIVRSPEGIVQVDETGKRKGRGTYLCRNRACWEAVLTDAKRNRLGYALRTSVSPENRQILLNYGRSLPSSEAMVQKGME